MFPAVQSSISNKPSSIVTNSHNRRKNDSTQDNKHSIFTIKVLTVQRGWAKPSLAIHSIAEDPDQKGLGRNVGLSSISFELMWASQQGGVDRPILPSHNDLEIAHQTVVRCAAITDKWFIHMLKLNGRYVFFVHWEKGAPGFAVHCKIALLHPTMLAMVHPVRAIGRLTKIQVVVPGNGFDMSCDSGQEVSNV